MVEVRFRLMTGSKAYSCLSTAVCSRNGMRELQRKLGYRTEGAVGLRFTKAGDSCGNIW